MTTPPKLSLSTALNVSARTISFIARLFARQAAVIIARRDPATAERMGANFFESFFSHLPAPLGTASTEVTLRVVGLNTPLACLDDIFSEGCIFSSPSRRYLREMFEKSIVYISLHGAFKRLQLLYVPSIPLRVFDLYLKDDESPRRFRLFLRSPERSKCNMYAAGRSRI